MNRLTIVLALAAIGADAGNRFSRQLAERSPADQANLLGQVVRSAGERCPTPTRPFYQGSYGSMAIWNVACGRRSWRVTIAADSATRVVACAPLAPCWRRF